MSSRPAYQRAASTNLKGGVGARAHEGKLAIVTGTVVREVRNSDRVDRCAFPLTKNLGIGAAIAKNLAAKGASLVLNYTSESSASKTETLAKELEEQHNIRAIAVQADMGDPKGPKHIVNTAQNNFSHPKTGKFQIDIIIQNAGIAENQAIEDVTAECFHRSYAVNVLGPLLLMQAALPYLPHDRSGRIVNLSSVSSSCGLHTQSVYGGTKAALEAMTRTWCRELAERATVNAVNPGPVSTDMFGSTSPEFQRAASTWVANTPLAAVREGIDDEKAMEWSKNLRGRAAYDHEIAGVVSMLCSEESGWCTGSVVCANGGLKFST
ncbi:MAG: hypothetical protein M1827_005475 [Pycnora praestabilis]|nr:MAG: hypothetical protein M1827_005475 [Pycnora praestabilis]